MNIKMPDRIARLPRDKRGYPIPWNVQRGKDDSPIFTVNDQEKHLRCLRSRLCPICGERLGKWCWFTGGILSAFSRHGAYYDLPGHHECESFALQVCPYLALPQYLGRIDVPDPSKVPDDVALVDITMMPERPEVFVAVATDKMTIRMQGISPFLIPERPYLLYEFWKTGRRIELEEALPYIRAKLGATWEPPATRVL